MLKAEPTVIDLVRELRQAVGQFDGAMPITPKQAWDEALAVVVDLSRGRCAACMDKKPG